MAKLRQIFEMTAGADADALLATPGLTYVLKLLRDAGETLCVEDLEQLYAAESWETDRSFTWLELQALQHKIQTTAVHADLVDTTANTVDSAHQHLHPGPAEDSVRADVNGETTLPRVLAVAEKESPQELLPACLVDVGGADVEVQASRRTLLARAIPADLAFAESLIATDYAQFLQRQAAEVRPCMSCKNWAYSVAMRFSARAKSAGIARPSSVRLLACSSTFAPSTSTGHAGSNS